MPLSSTRRHHHGAGEHGGTKGAGTRSGGARELPCIITKKPRKVRLARYDRRNDYTPVRPRALPRRVTR